MGLFEKRRCKNFLSWIDKYDQANPETYKKIDPKNVSMNEFYKKFELENNTIDFVGHAVALYTNDDYLEKPAIDSIHKIKLYMNSVGTYGDTPFIYPLYGLGGIPEGFSRLCAIHGGTFMLNTDIDKICVEDNKITGVK